MKEKGSAEKSDHVTLLELKHFVKAISGQSVPEIITPKQSLLSVKLIEAEKRSADSVDKVNL